MRNEKHIRLHVVDVRTCTQNTKAFDMMWILSNNRKDDDVEKRQKQKRNEKKK